MVMGLFAKLFGTRSEREVKKIQPLVDKILALEETYKNLSEEELKNLMIKEAERVLKAAPKLKPYKNEKGETIRTTFEVPVMFRLH